MNWFSAVPNAVTPSVIANTRNPTSRPYSVAVAPRSSRRAVVEEDNGKGVVMGPPRSPTNLATPAWLRAGKRRTESPAFERVLG